MELFSYKVQQPQLCLNRRTELIFPVACLWHPRSMFAGSLFKGSMFNVLRFRVGGSRARCLGTSMKTLFKVCGVLVRDL